MQTLGEEYVCVQDTDLASNWAELEENPVIQDVDVMLMNTVATNMLPEEV